MTMNANAFNLPNCLSAARLLAAPIMLLLAWFGLETAFLWLLLISFISDALDGFIARRWNMVTELGAQLDSIGDITVYITLIISAWWLWPELLLEQGVFTLMAIAGVLIPPLVSLLKFRSLSSYHTWMTKLSAVTMVPGGILLIFGGPVWLFRLACVLCFLAALEQMSISLYLKKKRSNLKTFYHVITGRT